MQVWKRIWALSSAKKPDKKRTADAFELYTRETLSTNTELVILDELKDFYVVEYEGELRYMLMESGSKELIVYSGGGGGSGESDSGGGDWTPPALQNNKDRGCLHPLSYFIHIMWKMLQFTDLLRICLSGTPEPFREGFGGV